MTPSAMNAAQMNTGMAGGMVQKQAPQLTMISTDIVNALSAISAALGGMEAGVERLVGPMPSEPCPDSEAKVSHDNLENRLKHIYYISCALRERSEKLLKVLDSAV